MVKSVKRRPRMQITKSEIIGYIEIVLGSAIAALTSYPILGGIVIGVGAKNVISGAYDAIKKL